MAARKTLKNANGFTLFEVMIAITIFAFFSAAFMTSQGFNILDSSKLKNEMTMKDLCQNKINEIITNPPELRDSLTLTKETKDFESNTNYQYSVEFKKFVLPDMNKLKNSADENEEEQANASNEKMIFNIFKENMEKIIWQVEVVVKDKTSEDTFRLSTWLYNQNADVNVKNF
jgi:prepilin-type N-terminal cleavage/methylation domain-containing protein